MYGLKAALVGVLVLASGSAFAHTTEVPHAHPHIVELSAGSSLIAVALFSISLALIIAARRSVIRRRK